MLADMARMHLVCTLAMHTRAAEPAPGVCGEEEAPHL